VGLDTDFLSEESKSKAKKIEKKKRKRKSKEMRTKRRTRNNYAHLPQDPETHDSGPYVKSNSHQCFGTS
jgi:hypothetical protein